MQISNPILSQFAGNVLQSQQTARLPVKPVTIEGQLVKEEAEEKRARGTTSDGNESSADSFVQELENDTQQQLIAPVPVSDNIDNTLLIQKKLNTAPELFNTSEEGFTFASRRSINGLSGGSLAIQNYLNNEPQTLAQSDNTSGRIDLFV